MELKKLLTTENLIKVAVLYAGLIKGSFVISFQTTGGTAIEEPVFNFAIIKSVTA